MSLLKPNDILEESWILFVLTGICGLQVVGPRHLQWLSYLWAIFLTVLYYVSFFLIRESIWQHYENFQDVIYYFNNQKLQGYFNLIVIPAIIFSSISKSSDYLKAYKNLDDIDRVLLYLNVPIDHEIQMRKETVRLFVYIFITLIVNLFTYFSIATADSGYIFNISWYLNFTPVFLEALTLGAFDIFVRKILVRLERINSVIENLMGPRRVSIILVQSTDINNVSKLRLARRVHLQLHDAASAINNAYGSRLFFIFFITLISVLNYVCEALNLIQNELQTLDLSLYLIWISFHLGKYFYIANSCRAATKEAKLTGGFFFEASLGRGLDGLNEEVKALSRQLINIQLQLTLCSIFSINFSKGLMIFIAVLTYFLMLA